jgi:lipid A 3-O-deacylase
MARGVTMTATIVPCCIAVAVVLTLFSAGRCDGQVLARGIRVTEQNDYLDFWLPPDRRPDDNYTQGVRIAWDSEHTIPLAKRLLCGTRAACGSAFEVGQEMYTPTTDDGSRPFAGWLYLRADAVAATERSRRIVSVTVGVTGSPSLAAQTQEMFHRLVPGFRRPTGWERQLPTEVDGALRVEEAWRLHSAAPVAHEADLIPWASATVGTLRTSIAAGARARVGLGLSHPWLTDPNVKRCEAYVFVGGQIEAVARDLFLDGDAFRRSSRVEREALVPNRELGVAARCRRLALEYRAVTQGKEYSSGPSTHPFGSIAVTWWIAR